jgi:hypothetical protein
LPFGIEEVALEEPAEQRRMDADLFGRQAGNLGHFARNMSGAWLGNHVQRAIGVEPRQGRRRFQLRVVEILAVVGGADGGLAAAKALATSPLLSATGALHRGEIGGMVGGGKGCRHRAIGGAARLQPIDLGRFHRAARMPEAWRDHGHGAIEHVHRMHALHRVDRSLVADLAHGQAQARRVLHGCVEHAIDFGVDRELRLAGGRRARRRRLRLADPAEILGILQRGRRGRHGQIERMGASSP